MNRKNTHASSSIACDGRLLFAVFCNHDSIQVSAIDMQGKTVWQRTASPFLEKKYSNGYAASPVLYGKTVIVVSDCETGSLLAALDRATGKPVWKTPRPAMSNYSSPNSRTRCGT